MVRKKNKLWFLSENTSWIGFLVTVFLYLVVIGGQLVPPIISHTRFCAQIFCLFFAFTLHYISLTFCFVFRNVCFRQCWSWSEDTLWQLRVPFSLLDPFTLIGVTPGSGSNKSYKNSHQSSCLNCNKDGPFWNNTRIFVVGFATHFWNVRKISGWPGDTSHDSVPGQKCFVRTDSQGRWEAIMALNGPPPPNSGS